MNRRQLIILCAVAGALLAAAVVRRLWSAREQPAEQAEEVPSLALPVSVDAVDRITLTKGTDAATTVELRKVGGAWQVPSLWGIAADGGKVRKFLEGLSRLQGELRGDSPELFSDFAVADDQALHVALFEGVQETVHVLLGTPTASWHQFFIRRANAPHVYLVPESDVLSQAGLYSGVKDSALKAEMWADFTLFTFATDAVQRVELKPRGGTWRELGTGLPFERDAGQFASYLQGLLNLRALGVLDPQGTNYGFDDPEWELRIALKGPPEIVVTVGALKSGSSTDRYLRVSGSPHVYGVSRYALEQMQVDGSRFLKSSNMLGAEKAALASLTVHVPERELTVSPKDTSWPGLDEYLKSLESFRVLQVDGLPAPATPPVWNRAWLRLQPDEQEPVTIACEPPADASAVETRCINQGNQVEFLIARSTFQAVFEDLDRLQEPPPSPEASSSTAPPASSTVPPGDPASPASSLSPTAQ